MYEHLIGKIVAINAEKAAQYMNGHDQFLVEAVEFSELRNRWEFLIQGTGTVVPVAWIVGEVVSEWVGGLICWKAKIVEIVTPETGEMPTEERVITDEMFLEQQATNEKRLAKTCRTKVSKTCIHRQQIVVY